VKKKLQRKRTKKPPKFALEVFNNQQRETELGGLSELAGHVWAAESAADGQVSLVLVDDAQLLTLNRRHLRRDTLTDVIAFTLSEPGAPLLEGEIYISVERICENAKTYESESAVELRRVTVHGLLHLLGYEDATAAGKDIMRAREDHYLGLTQAATVRS